MFCPTSCRKHAAHPQLNHGFSPCRMPARLPAHLLAVNRRLKFTWRRFASRPASRPLSRPAGRTAPRHARRLILFFPLSPFFSFLPKSRSPAAWPGRRVGCGPDGAAACAQGTLEARRHALSRPAGRSGNWPRPAPYQWHDSADSPCWWPSRLDNSIRHRTAASSMRRSDSLSPCLLYYVIHGAGADGGAYGRLPLERRTSTVLFQLVRPALPQADARAAPPPSPLPLNGGPRQGRGRRLRASAGGCARRSSPLPPPSTYPSIPHGFSACKPHGVGRIAHSHLFVPGNYSTRGLPPLLAVAGRLPARRCPRPRAGVGPMQGDEVG